MKHLLSIDASKFCVLTDCIIVKYVVAVVKYVISKLDFLPTIKSWQLIKDTGLLTQHYNNYQNTYSQSGYSFTYPEIKESKLHLSPQTQPVIIVLTSF